MRRFGLALLCGSVGMIVGLAAPMLVRSWPSGIWPVSAHTYPQASPIMAHVRAVVARHEPYHISETYTQYLGRKNSQITYEQADVAPRLRAEIASYTFSGFGTGQVAIFGKRTWIKDDDTNGRWERRAHYDINCASGFIDELETPLSTYLHFRHFMIVGAEPVHGVATWHVRGSKVEQGYRVTVDLNVGQRDARLYRVLLHARDSTGQPVVTDQETLSYAGEQGRIRLPAGAKPGPSPSSSCTVINN